MKKIPNNTKYFEYLNCNPKNKIGDDCVIRAIATYFDKSWVDIVKDLTNYGIKYGYVVNDQHCFSKYLKDHNLIKQKEPRDIFNKKISVKKWLEMNPNASCIANVGSHHLTVIQEGKVKDIWDCSNNTMHSYWN